MTRDARSGRAFSTIDLMQPLIEVAETKLEASMHSVHDLCPRAHCVLEMGVA